MSDYTMTAETRTCQNCKGQFIIEPDDFAFYEHLKVPAPTFCAPCRSIRRMQWRNERTLYRRVCDLCKRNIVSAYSPKSPYTVYCSECFYGDGWDPLSFGVDYDFSKPFFEQYRELQYHVPRLALFVIQNVQSEYVNGAACDKNCYLIFVSDHNEDSMYSYWIMHSKNTVDCYDVLNSELCYECISCIKCHRIAFSKDCSDCTNVFFSKNCANCQDCVGCFNLRNKRYHILNEPYTKETYLEKLKELRLDTREGIHHIQEAVAPLERRHIVKYIHGSHNTDVTGDYLYNSKASRECYSSDKLEDSKNIIYGDTMKNCHDAYVLVDGSQYAYELIGSISVNDAKFGCWVWHGFNTAYADTCVNANNLFGCISVRKKDYCILNKQYTKESFDELKTKIIQHMNEMPFTDTNGAVYRYGEFFPYANCPFAYNESVCQEHAPLTKETAAAKGFAWREPEERDYKITLAPDKVPATIAEVEDTITQEVVGCAHNGSCNHNCTTAFRITPQELQFYRRMNVPLPTLCFSCRHHARLAHRNPYRLCAGTCACGGAASKNGVYRNTAPHAHGANACPAEFATTYPADYQGIIYCEPCYQQEVA